MPQPLLFNERPFSDLVDAYPRLLAKEIDELDKNKVLNASFSDLCDYLVGHYILDVPRLKVDEIHSLDPEDTTIDVSWDRSRYFRDPESAHIKGTAFTLCVPFEGDPDLFQCQPSTFFSNGIRGEVSGQTLLLRHERHDHDPKALKADFDDRLQKLQGYLETQRQQSQQWNAQLPERAKALLEARKSKLLEAQDVAESLGYPLKRREATTYEVPVTRKRLAVQMPAAPAVPYTPEPALAVQQYDEILQIIASMAVMMERSPSAFATMGEEHLRDHALVILNTHFEGQATGETFNKGGKTDILVREKDRNVFIAECKFWDGPKSLISAIDQLLSYACWRDTKLAVVVFNRRKDFSAVLETIPDTVTAHPQCKRRLDYGAEGGFRFLLKQKDDQNREMTLTVLAFDVPTPDPEPSSGRAVPEAAAAPPTLRRAARTQARPAKRKKPSRR